MIYNPSVRLKVLNFLSVQILTFDFRMRAALLYLRKTRFYVIVWRVTQSNFSETVRLISLYI